MTTNYRTFPATVVIDNREQHPFAFTGYKADAKHGGLPLVIPVTMGTLHTGDYSLEGYESIITVERKSHGDAVSTFIHNRERWERELERMQEFAFAGVVLECSFKSLMEDRLECSPQVAKSLFRSIVAWQVRYRQVQWHFGPTRSWAERATLRWLERFYLDEQERLKHAT